MMKRKSLVLFVFAMCVLGAFEAIGSDALKVAMQVEDAFAEVVEKARPAVVVIVNKQYRSSGITLRDFGDFPDFFGFPRSGRSGRRFRRSEEKQLVPSSGSGVLIAADGMIVTNYHVIKDFEFLTVKLEDGTIYVMQKDKDAVKVVGVDEESDLAVLQVGGGKKKNFKYLDFADSDKLRIGQWAIAIGAPFELEHSVTVGNVSQKGRHDMGMATFDNYVQTDAPINPGNSGGPLLNIKGEIIGINQFIVTGGQSRGNIGLGFAIASNLVKQVVADLVDHGEVNRPFLGISMQQMSDELKEQFCVEYGVIVSEVLEGEAALKAGVKAGDVIQKVGGKPVDSVRELLLAVTAYKPGDKIRLDIIRAEKPVTVDVVAGKRNIGAYSNRMPSSPEDNLQLDRLGLELEVVEDKVVVGEIKDGGAVAKSNSNNENKIREGDVLLEVNRVPVKNIGEVADALKKSHNNTVVFLIERKMRGQARRFFIAIPLK